MINYTGYKKNICYFLLVLLSLLLFSLSILYADDEFDEAADDGFENEESDDFEEELGEEIKLKVIYFGDPQDTLPNYPKFRVKVKGFSKFKISDRLRNKEYWKCSGCHDGKKLKSRPQKRELFKEHEDIKLEHILMKHGKEDYWCTTCHDTSRPDYLVDLRKQPIHFDQSFLLCGQCHSTVQRDWLFGAHGKRIGNWSGERVVLLCTECHNPHSPSIKKAKPDPAPEMHKHRRPDIDHWKIHTQIRYAKPWERMAAKRLEKGRYDAKHQ
jgi:hypothetical protein